MNIGKIVRIASRVARPILVAVKGIIEALEDGVVTGDEAASIACDALAAAGYHGKLAEDTVEAVVLAAVALAEDLLTDTDDQAEKVISLPHVALPTISGRQGHGHKGKA